MELITDRTILIPISIEIIDAVSNGTLNEYYHNEEWPENDLKEAFPVFKELLKENGIDGFNLWLIVDKKNNQIIGSAGYIGRPDNEGNIEIGFGIIPSKRKSGFCNESVKALIEWGLSHDEVISIIAQCGKSNIASKKTIIKLGFEYIGEEDDLLTWKYERH
ncbi:MAG: GNAT family N-acetyltransferase [Dysgonamonadaceae bacterium]|jgi:RimJ/RimL family protein N-acetyltransferase|nr:GNAT family N-acetyltransferase [Dysgonamonadaceae bacterium]